MGSSFVDLDATSTAMKTKLDSDAWFERYRIFRIQIKKEKKEKGHKCTVRTRAVHYDRRQCTAVEKGSARAVHYHDAAPCITTEGSAAQ